MDQEIGNPENTGIEGTNGNVETSTLKDAFSSVMGNNEPASEPINNGDNEPGKSDLPTWTAQLPSELKNNSELMNKLGRFGKIGDLVNSYNELESKLGNSLNKPGKDATADELNAYYEKLGRPKTADDYSFSKDDTLQLKQVAFDLGLTEEQATGIYNKLTERGNLFVNNLKEASQKKFEETDAALRQEHGNKYSEKMVMLKRGIMANGGQKLGEVLEKAGVLYDKQVVDLFIRLGEQNTEANINTKGETVTDSYKSVYNGGTMQFKGLK